MKEVKKFEAFDGRIFDTEFDCFAYEERERAIKKVMDTLEPLPKDDGCAFSNGDGYVQQDRAKVEKAMLKIVKLSGIKQSPEFLENPFACRHGVIGRYLSDGDFGSCYFVWGRFMNMDAQTREWGQAYFALNPKEGKQRARN